MVNNLIEKIEKEIMVSELKNLEGNFKFNTRKVYIKNNVGQYHEYDELELIINVLLEGERYVNESSKNIYLPLETNIYSIRLTINSYDYTFYLYNHFSYTLIKEYKLNQLKETINYSYKYLTKKKYNKNFINLKKVI